MEEKVLLFVYGSLLKGEINDWMMVHYKCVAENVWIYGQIYDAGEGYPFLKIHINQRVYSELYVIPVTDLPKMDKFGNYEPGGKDNLYERKVISVNQQNNNWKAYVYVGNKPEISEKSWRDYRRKQKKIFFYDNVFYRFIGLILRGIQRRNTSRKKVI